VKVGRTDFTSKQVAENTMAAIHGLVQKVPRKWKNIQSMHLKSTDSIALPIYNALPDANVAMAIVAESDGKTSKRAREEDNEEAEVVVGKKKKTTKKQKKQKTAVGDRFASLQKAESDSKSRKKR